jgi:hypothetical protein
MIHFLLEKVDHVHELIRDLYVSNYVFIYYDCSDP